MVYRVIAAFLVPGKKEPGFARFPHVEGPTLMHVIEAVDAFIRKNKHEPLWIWGREDD